MLARMTTPRPLPVQLLIFGGAGDLARRKLLPALVRLGARNRLPSPLTVVAVGRRAMSDGSRLICSRTSSGVP